MKAFRCAAVLFLALAPAAPAFADEGQTGGERRLTRNAASGERRVALVVGNNAYAAAPLKNAVADARAIGATLREVGFTVTLLENATRDALIRAVAQIGDGLDGREAALFFFAGHGVQLGGENYLIPVDFAGDSATSARLSSLSASEVQEVFSRARVSLVVLDACRNNPFTGQRAGGGGLAPMEGRGSLVAFATGAGRTASDNTAGQNGLFTRELLSVLREPNLSARDVFYRVRQRVYDASQGQQFPAVYDGLIGEFVFRPAAHVPAPAAAALPPDNADLALRAELAVWESIGANGTAQEYEEYLRQYPSGRFRVTAQTRLKALAAASVPPVSASSGSSSAPTDATPRAFSLRTRYGGMDSEWTRTGSDEWTARSVNGELLQFRHLSNTVVDGNDGMILRVVGGSFEMFVPRAGSSGQEPTRVRTRQFGGRTWFVDWSREIHDLR